MTFDAVSSRLRTRDLAYIALFAVLIAVCAWISIPFAVPFTMQLFGIFLALSTLGGRRGTYAVAVYLLLGAAGIPVFAGFRGGLAVLLGATGGYVAGFFLSALLYWVITAKLGESVPVQALACVLGLLICYLFGTIWFLVVYSHTTGPISLLSALGLCVFPYLIPDLLKLTLALSLSRRVRGFLH